MAGTRNSCRLLPSRVAQTNLSKPPARVLDELVSMTDTDLSISELSRALFLGLRKQTGTPDLLNSLLGIQYLGFKGDLAGARLLAAYLDVTTAGARLIPYIRNFSNSRRQQCFLADFTGELDASAKDWHVRATDLMGICESFTLPVEEMDADVPSSRLRGVMGKLLSDVITGDGISEAHRQLLADLMRLETDAWEERIGRLAGMVNPYRVSSVQRVLPILGQADVSIRDLRQLISWVREGQDRQAFSRQGFRAMEVLEEQEFNKIYDTMKTDMKLQVLAGLHRGGRDNPMPLPLLGTCTARLLALDYRLVESGIKKRGLDLLSAVALVQQYARGKSLVLPLDQDQEALMRRVLASPDLKSPSDRGPSSWSFEGFTMDVGQFILDFNSKSGELMAWPHGLPSPEDVDPLRPVTMTSKQDETPDLDEKKKDLDASAIKHLVMSNIMSISVLLGFLRNPKVIAIPGLVAAVANRTRNSQIITTIATDRALYTGFANREVPLACLNSPCNVPPKTLRKFIHVKFVSKIDLKRMANDRTGIRKEIAKEIKLYLDVLG